MPQAEGQVFGKYQLLDRIAAGGMAEIYRAKYTGAAGVTKPVVVKKILPHYAGNKSFISMFVNEAKIAAGLSHGNIAQIFDFGEIDGEYFLAMEFVDGQPLSRVLRRMRDIQIPVMPTTFAVYITIETLKGLHYAHTRLDEQGRPLNIIHRDVSPQNVILSYEGQVKIVDFGIAKARHAGRTETEAGAVKGKYVYFAPEQAKGKDLDLRTDIFATGILLYEQICGRLPFEGKMMEVLGKIIRNDYPRPRTINPDIPAELERILVTAMETEKADRYPSALAFQDALGAYLATSEPTFGGGQLGHLMSWLYEKELVAEGRPVQLPKDFVAQVPAWRKKLPSLEAPTELEMPAQSLPTPLAIEKPAAPTLEELDVDAMRRGTERELSLVNRLPTRWLFLLVPLAAAMIAALVVLVVGHFGSFSVQLTSTPPGGDVYVDGQRAPGVTPLVISNLSADRPHRLRVVLSGMKTWSQQVEPAAGNTVYVNAPLEPEAPPPAPAPRPAPRVTPTPPTLPVPAPNLTSANTPSEPDRSEDGASDVTFPPRKPIVLDARQHVCLIPKTAAARLELDAAKTYKVWADGGGTVFYFLQGPRELTANEASGVITSRPKQLKHAWVLFAFTLVGGSTDSTKIHVQDKGDRTLTLNVSGSENAVDPDRDERFRVRGLDPSKRYAVTLREGSTPARLGEGKAGRISHVLFAQNTGWGSSAHQTNGDDAYQALEVGTRIEISGAEHFIVFFADDKKTDNDGTLTLEVTPSRG